MKYPFYRLTFLVLIVLYISCGQNSKSQNSSESELINRVNAVQEQIMVQGNMSEEEEQALLSLCNIISKDDGLSNVSTENQMVLRDVETAPIYEGCEELTNEETEECFKTKVASFVKREFNLNLLRDLNLSEPKQVDAFFVIDQSGNVAGFKVRESEVTIQGEILRVLRKLPVMKPAIHNGKPVSVLCSIIVTYGDDIDIEVVYVPERLDD
ncbi:hypothetical protein Q2T40_12275 [Winogradskyella maritima]|uniref:TonB-like protein n=1 Tax=Winogradskyella maritima TaxID=1517766 RepID=A0ABV8AKF8_9FLAO|nr:hypothetical protein [Winogradskyella maritima]